MHGHHILTSLTVGQIRLFISSTKELQGRTKTLSLSSLVGKVHVKHFMPGTKGIPMIGTIGMPMIGKIGTPMIGMIPLKDIPMIGMIPLKGIPTGAIIVSAHKTF